jgi:hypothetical protein
MENLICSLKNYNWKHLISDILVVMLAAGFSVLLDRMKALDVQTLGPTATGATAFIINKFRKIC